MNTCARLESSSQPNRIQCSKETAEQLIKLGKGGWVKRRTGPMPFLKGKGSLEGFWVQVDGDRAGSVASVVSSQKDTAMLPVTVKVACGKNFPGMDDRTKRLIDWNVEMLVKLLQTIAARRAAGGDRNISKSTKQWDDKIVTETSTKMPLEEVREIITLPEFDTKASHKQIHLEDMKIPETVVQQLHHLVSSIASMYNKNPFHNFDHASHVVMSVIKLMSRIVAPSQLLDGASDKDAAASLHDHTYGITSDPLTQFACAFSALIHDVDHVGVSNAQLVKEGVPIAKQYQDRSVAEQRSLDLSWSLLMSPNYHALREFLFPTQDDLVRFRQLVINVSAVFCDVMRPCGCFCILTHNSFWAMTVTFPLLKSVMSTDIVDKDLKSLRNDRWEKAFRQEGTTTDALEDHPRDTVNRKATIVVSQTLVCTGSTLVLFLAVSDLFPIFIKD